MADDRIHDSPRPPGRFVETSTGVRVFVELSGPEGDAPTVLILDGLGCAGWGFRKVVPALQSHFRVALLHYRGHGYSPEPPRPWRMGIHEQADDAADVLEALGGAAAVVVGFSTGFQVALELYKRHRDRVLALMSIAGPPRNLMGSFPREEVLQRAVTLSRATVRFAEAWSSKTWRRVLPSQFARWVGMHTQVNLARIDLEDLELYLSQLAKMPPELFLDFLAEGIRYSGDDVLSRIRVPTTVMAGARDRFIGVDAMRSIVASVPGARWVLVDESSHALPAEYPELVVEEISRLVDQTSGQPRPRATQRPTP